MSMIGKRGDSMRFIVDRQANVYGDLASLPDDDRQTLQRILSTPTVCEIEIAENVILCTELATNPGQSITNAAEYIATAACRRFAIPFDKLIWIEHYNEESYKGRGQEETFDLVTFEITPVGFQHPCWRPLTEEEKAQYLLLFQEKGV